jgi:hypothetical protein
VITITALRFFENLCGPAPEFGGSKTRATTSFAGRPCCDARQHPLQSATRLGVAHEVLAGGTSSKPAAAVFRIESRQGANAPGLLDPAVELGKRLLRATYASGEGRGDGR